MHKRTLRLFALLLGAFMLLVLTAATAFGAQLSPIQQESPPEKTRLTQQQLEQFWRDQFPASASVASDGSSNVYTHELLAKAQPDECYSGIGVPVTGTLPDCEGGQPKVNQAYVWGMTDYANTIWFGTAPNVHCLVMGGFLGATSPVETDSYVCEFGASRYVPPLPAIIGDWRPPKLYVYDNDDKQLTDVTPKTLPWSYFISTTLGIRSATTYGDYVIFAGPALTPTQSINMFLFNAATRTFVSAKNLAGYTNIRKWINVNGVLYAAVGTPTGGAVLRYTGNPASVNPAQRFTFIKVGDLDADGAEIALHDGRLFVNTWPNGLSLCNCNPTYAGLWMSPVLPNKGITTTDSLNWQKVFTYTEYEPDPVSAATYGGGALYSYKGDLYFGTMHVPFLNTLAHVATYGVTVTQDISSAILGTQRTIAIFRGHDFGTPQQEVQLLYGADKLPVYVDDPTTPGWVISPTLMGPPLYGPSGFGNIFNNYTWSMSEYDGQLFVGTMDWSYLLTDLIDTFQNAIQDIIQLPINIRISLPDANPGADLFRFYSATDPAIAQDQTGVGNYSSYGVRNLLGRPDGLYLGMANPMNLLTNPDDDKPEGGWELLRLTRDLVPVAVDLAGNGNGSVTSDLGGINCGATCTVSLDRGTTVALTAHPAADSLFTGWDGACHGTGGCSVTLNATQAVTATFTKKQFALNVQLDGDGSGQVVSVPAGIGCSLPSCSTNFDIGTPVTLTATSFLGSEFTGWSGACSGTGDCHVTINAATVVKATFDKQIFALNVDLAGNGSGSVSSNLGKIDCGETCADNYAYGTTVNLTPSAGADSVLASWGGACSGTGPCSVTLTADTVVTATFAKKQFPLTVHIAGDGSGQVSSVPAGIGCSQSTCSANFEIGTPVALSAAGFAGSSFAGWSGACSGTASCPLTMNSANEVTATFSLNAGAASIEVSGKLFPGQPLTYTANLNMNNVTQCTWDFGDGNTEECDLPASTAGVGTVHDITVQTTHSYAQTGTYLITVTAVNDAGTVVASQQISIVSEGPTADTPTGQPGPDKKLYFPLVNP